jgi:urease accessory protein UreH
MQCTPGLFGGDNVEMRVLVERGARVLMTQQSATRIHPSEDRPAFQNSWIHVESGAELQYILEPSIPFAGSRLHQTTSIELEPGARLLFWEGFMAGRVGRGEFWELSELRTETVLKLGDHLLYLDRFRIEPHSIPTSVWAMHRNTYLGTGLYYGERAEDFAKCLHSDLPQAGVDNPESRFAAARVVTSDGPAFHRARETFRKLGMERNFEKPESSSDAMMPARSGF